MESKYDQDAWRIIFEEHLNTGCCVSETLRVVRTKYPSFAHLARKTFEDYLRSPDGRRQLDEEMKAHESEIKATLALNLEKWNRMSLDQLWEACAKELLISALAGDRDAVRQSIKFLRTQKGFRQGQCSTSDTAPLPSIQGSSVEGSQETGAA